MLELVSCNQCAICSGSNFRTIVGWLCETILESAHWISSQINWRCSSLSYSCSCKLQSPWWFLMAVPIYASLSGPLPLYTYAKMPCHMVRSVVKIPWWPSSRTMHVGTSCLAATDPTTILLLAFMLSWWGVINRRNRKQFDTYTHVTHMCASMKWQLYDQWSKP